MKAVILAGGLGTRISEETHLKPKPMIEIGGRPILWHIMKIYSAHGITDFIICCGYKGYLIKEYFANYFLHMSDVTFDMTNNRMEVHQKKVEPWRVTLVDTGENTLTGGRLKRVADYLDKEEDSSDFADDSDSKDANEEQDSCDSVPCNDDDLDDYAKWAAEAAASAANKDKSSGNSGTVHHHIPMPMPNFMHKK